MRQEEIFAPPHEEKRHVPKESELEEDELYMQYLVAAASDPTHPDFTQYYVKEDPALNLVHIYRAEGDEKILSLNSQEFHIRQNANRSLAEEQRAASSDVSQDSKFVPKKTVWH